MHFGLIPNDRWIDHKDGDPINNRIENLRLANRSQNGSNRGKNKNNTSGYKGVMFYKRCQKWTAQIKVNGKSKSLGYFNTPELAHEAYKSASKVANGEFANY